MAIANPVLATPAAFESSTPPRSVQWGAVILGALGATAISMVLLTFGAGIGLSATSAQPYAGASAKAIAIISGLYTAVVLVDAASDQPHQRRDIEIKCLASLRDTEFFPAGRPLRERQRPAIDNFHVHADFLAYDPDGTLDLSGSAPSRSGRSDS